MDFNLFLKGLICIQPFVLAYLIHYLNEKGKNLATKEDVRRITEIAESVKTQFASRLHISQIRYEKEFEILTALTEKLVELRNSALGLRPQIDSYDSKVPEEERKQKRLNRYFDAMHSLYLASETKRPFYPEEIYTVLKEFDQAAWAEAVGYKHQSVKADPKYWDEAQRNATEITKLAEKTLGAIRKRIQLWEKLDTPSKA